LENLTLRGEVNQLQQLVEIKIKVAQLLANQEPTRIGHILRQAFNFDQGLEHEFVSVAVGVAAHGGCFFKVPYDAS
jgi:hypothetical protein